MKEITAFHMARMVFFITLVSIYSCSQEKGDWVDAKDNIYALEEFQIKYPESSFLSKARNRIDSLAFEFAKENGSLLSYKYCIDNYPNSNNNLKILELVQEIKKKWHPDFNDITNVYLSVDVEYNNKMNYDIENEISKQLSNIFIHTIKDRGNADAIITIKLKSKEKIGNYVWVKEGQIPPSNSKGTPKVDGIVMTGILSIDKKDKNVLKIPIELDSYTRPGSQFNPVDVALEEFTLLFEKDVIHNKITNNTLPKNITRIGTRNALINDIRVYKDYVILRTKGYEIYVLNKSDGTILYKLWKDFEDYRTFQEVLTVNNDIIFVVAKTNGDKYKTLIKEISAYSLINGELIWTKEINIKSGIKAECKNNYLYILFCENLEKNLIQMLNSQTGEIIKTLSLESYGAGQGEEYFTIHDQVLYYYNSRMHAIDLITDTLLWEIKNPAINSYTNITIPFNVYLKSNGGFQRIRALNMMNKELEWTHEPKKYSSLERCVIYYNDLVIIKENSSHGDITYALNKENGKIKWKLKQVTNGLHLLAADDNYLYMGGNQQIVAIDGNNGLIKWKWISSDEFSTFSTFTIQGNNILFANRYAEKSGNIYALDKNSGFLIRKIDMPSFQFYVPSNFCILGDNSIIMNDLN